MENSMEKVLPIEERKSAKYKPFPDAGPGVWGPEIREKHYDQLGDSIRARIRHISSRIDQYLPPYDGNYRVDQTLALNLENSFDELAQLYLKLAEDQTYSFEPIKVFDEKLEKIQELIINSEKPFFDEKEGQILVDKDGNQIGPVGDMSIGDNFKKLSEEEKNKLHEEGTKMLQEAVDEIHKLKTILENRLPLAV